MKIGRVIGKVVATRKSGNLDGKSLLVVSYLDHELQDTNKTAACVDTVNAGEGEIVLLCSSSSARLTETTREVATDNTIIAIIDTISAEKKTIYTKNKDQS